MLMHRRRVIDMSNHPHETAPHPEPARSIAAAHHEFGEPLIGTAPADCPTQDESPAYQETEAVLKEFESSLMQLRNHSEIMQNLTTLDRYDAPPSAEDHPPTAEKGK
jgi:hypothetical protein